MANQKVARARVTRHTQRSVVFPLRYRPDVLRRPPASRRRWGGRALEVRSA
jgi:hypothetical protein